MCSFVHEICTILYMYIVRSNVCTEKNARCRKNYSARYNSLLNDKQYASSNSDYLICVGLYYSRRIWKGNRTTYVQQSGVAYHTNEKKKKQLVQRYVIAILYAVILATRINVNNLITWNSYAYANRTIFSTRYFARVPITTATRVIVYTTLRFYTDVCILGSWYAVKNNL